MAFLFRLLRLRYLILGTAVGGGYAARKVTKFTRSCDRFRSFSLSLLEI